MRPVLRDASLLGWWWGWVRGSVPLELLHDRAPGRRVGEHGAHEHVRAPQGVADHLAAAQVLDLEAQQAVALVRLKQRVVGVGAEELRGGDKHTRQGPGWLFVNGQGGSMLAGASVVNTK